MRRIGMLVGMVVGISTLAQSQSFDVATIKRAPGRERVAIGCRGVDAGPPTVPQGRCRYLGVTLKTLIMAAYNVRVIELEGATGWMDLDLYTVEGVAPDTATVKQQELMAMLQRQIEESFRLKFHHEMRTVQGYVLTVADEKKLVPAGDEKIPVSFRFMMLGDQPNFMAFNGPLANLPTFLSRYLNAPVKDATELTTSYKVELDWGRAPDIVEGQAALFALLPEKGFKLRAEKVAVDMMVIDSAEKPKETP